MTISNNYRFRLYMRAPIMELQTVPHLQEQQEVITMTPIADNEIDRLAWTLERTGIAGHEDAIDQVVERARPVGVTPVLVDVLASPAEPENARIRAFGRVALELGRRDRTAA